MQTSLRSALHKYGGVAILALDRLQHVVLTETISVDYAKERLWHPSQKLTDLDDGGVLLAFRAGPVRNPALGFLVGGKPSRS